MNSNKSGSRVGANEVYIHRTFQPALAAVDAVLLDHGDSEFHFERNMKIAVDLGAAERQRFLAVKRVSAVTERDPDAGGSAGSATQEVQ